ncbi:hypothetical protein D3C84_1281700 [compost metagenome]
MPAEYQGQAERNQGSDQQGGEHPAGLEDAAHQQVGQAAGEDGTEGVVTELG